MGKSIRVPDNFFDKLAAEYYDCVQREREYYQTEQMVEVWKMFYHRQGIITVANMLGYTIFLMTDEETHKDLSLWITHMGSGRKSVYYTIEQLKEMLNNDR